jgi:hypothetical protein
MLAAYAARSNPCHLYEAGPLTTEAAAHVCGRCGGDRRRPDPAHDLVRYEAERRALAHRARTRAGA